MTNGFDLDHVLDLWILKVKYDLELWPHTWPWPWIFMVKFWNSCISEWEGRLTLHKGGGSRSGGSRSFMTMTVTIWWPRSGVWIYQIVTGVTSVVGVPSTHLVIGIKHIENIETGQYNPGFELRLLAILNRYKRSAYSPRRKSFTGSNAPLSPDLNVTLGRKHPAMR